MTAKDILASIRDAGGEVVVVDGKAKLRAGAPLPQDLVALARSHKAEILDLLAEPRLLAEPDCQCLVCRPDLWPGGYRTVLATFPLWATRDYLVGVKAHLAVGVTQEQAERLAYLEVREELRRRG